MHHVPRILILIGSLGLAACAADSTPEPGRLSTPPAGEGATDGAPPGATAAPVPDELPGIVARINGTEVTRAEFERAIRAAESKAGQVVPPPLRDQVYRRLLDRLIDFHLLLQESRTRAVAVDDAEVDAEVARIRDSYPTVDAFEQQLRDWNTSVDVLREETRKDLLIAKTVELELTPAGAPADDAVRAFYDQHPDQFERGDAMRARHILIGAAPNDDPAARTRAQETAAELQVRADAGDDFSTLARDHSTDDSTAPHGGDLGLIERGQTVPPFEAALFALEPGEISPVVESPFGYHVIQAGERRDAGLVPFERARDQIRTMLQQQARQRLVSALLARLREAGNVEILI